MDGRTTVSNNSPARPVRGGEYRSAQGDQMTKKISGLFVATMALAGVMGTSTKADAALMAYICDDALCTGGGDTIVTDQGVGDNFPGSALVGQINSGALSVA